MLQNNWQAATIHWACQFAGIIVTPVNWRAKDDEIDFYIENAEARAIAYQDVSAAGVAARKRATQLPRIAVAVHRRMPTSTFAHSSRQGGRCVPRVKADAWSLMLYTSGTTSRPKGVPAGTAERAAAIAHVAQNLYAQRRAHARRHAALPHHGRALVAGDVADRRHFRLLAAIRCRVVRSR